MLLRVNLTT